MKDKTKGKTKAQLCAMIRREIRRAKEVESEVKWAKTGNENWARHCRSAREWGQYEGDPRGSRSGGDGRAPRSGCCG